MNQSSLDRITGDMTVNEIVNRFPVTVAVFKAFKIDSCCGGALPLQTVLEKHQLEGAGVLEALRNVAEAR